MPYIGHLKSGISRSLRVFSWGSCPALDLATKYPHEKEQISACSTCSTAANLANLAGRQVAFEVGEMKESVTLMTMNSCFVLVWWMRDKAMAKEVELWGQSYSWKGGLQMGRKSQGEVNESLGEHWLKNGWPDTTYKSRTDDCVTCLKTFSNM